MTQFWGRSPYPGSFRTLHSCQLLIRKASGSVSRGPGFSKNGLLTFVAKFAVVLVEWHCQALGGPGIFHCRPQKPWQLKDGTRPTYKCTLSLVGLPECLCHQHAPDPPPPLSCPPLSGHPNLRSRPVPSFASIGLKF